MAQQNSIDNKTSELTIDPASASDSFIQLNESTVAKWKLGNDATDDSFRLNQGSTLGDANDTFLMTSAGERTMPLQPAFLAKRDSSLSNVTGDGTNYGPIVFDNEIFDQNSDYNSGTGVFTASVAGRYIFFVNLYIDQIAGGHTRGTIYSLPSNGQTYLIDCNFANFTGSSGFKFASSFTIDMDAADTVDVYLLVSGGAKAIDIVGNGTSARLSTFGGYLVC